MSRPEPRRTIRPGSTAASARRPWRMAFAALALVYGATGAAFLARPDLAARARAGGELFQEALQRIVLDPLPPAVAGLVARGAEFFLTPWLYLLVLLVLIAERAYPAIPEQRPLSPGFGHDFALWFAFDGAVRTLVLGPYLVGLFAFYERFLGWIPSPPIDAWPLALRAGLSVLVVDLLAWGAHVLKHKIDLLWRFHEIHHSQRELNLFSDHRVHLVEDLFALPLIFWPLYALHLDVQLAFWVVFLRAAYTRTYHANLATHYGPLRHLLVTPQSHRIHHSAEPRHADKNFGVLLTLWDRLFGTSYRAFEEYPRTGIEDPVFPHEQGLHWTALPRAYLLQMAYPFRALRGDRGRG